MKLFRWMLAVLVLAFAVGCESTTTESATGGTPNPGSAYLESMSLPVVTGVVAAPGPDDPGPYDTKEWARFEARFAFFAPGIIQTGREYDLNLLAALITEHIDIEDLDAEMTRLIEETNQNFDPDRLDLRTVKSRSNTLRAELVVSAEDFLTGKLSRDVQSVWPSEMASWSWKMFPRRGGRLPIEVKVFDGDREITSFVREIDVRLPGTELDNRAVASGAEPETSLRETARDKCNTPDSAPSGRRFALLIGNAAYQYAAFSPLTNPSSDVAELNGPLFRAGFDVMQCTDLTTSEFGAALKAFQNRIATHANKDAEVEAVIYYSGHGVAVRSDSGFENYMLPIDLKSANPSEIRDHSYGFEQLVMTFAEPQPCPQQDPTAPPSEACAPEPRLVDKLILISDACRNIPELNAFANSKEVSTKGAFGKIHRSQGAQYLFFYSNKFGMKSLDDGNFGRILAAEIGVEERIEANTAFKGVQVRVLAANGQEPRWDNNMTPEFFFGSKSATVN